jgi:hypothetical protein
MPQIGRTLKGRVRYPLTLVDSSTGFTHAQGMKHGPTVAIRQLAISPTRVSGG